MKRSQDGFLFAYILGSRDLLAIQRVFFLTMCARRFLAKILCLLYLEAVVGWRCDCFYSQFPRPRIQKQRPTEGRQSVRFALGGSGSGSGATNDDVNEDDMVDGTR